MTESTGQDGGAAGAVHEELPALKGLPSNLTFNDLIARNKRNSTLLVLIMFTLITLFGSSL